MWSILANYQSFRSFAPVILYYKTLGHGPALVILHGLFGMLDNWMRIGNAMAASHTVYLVDQRNHGRSGHDMAHSYSLMAADLAETLDAEGVRGGRYFGAFYGGKDRYSVCHRLSGADFRFDRRRYGCQSLSCWPRSYFFGIGRP